MRPLIRSTGVLVASGLLVVAVTSAAKTTSKAPGARQRKKKNAVERDAEAFLASVSSLIQPVATVTDNIDWIASTDVTPEHTAERAGADKVFAALVGSKTIIEKTKGFLKNEKQLDDLTARQLHKLLLSAAENPGTIPEIVARRVEAEARLSGVLDSYTFCLQPKPGGGCLKPITANGIDDVLLKSRDLGERLRVWNASKEIGKPLKPGLVELVGLRNQVAREMGYKSYFALKVADYGMSVDEMMALLDDTLATTKPLFDGLHCWARNTLATRYKRPVPKLIPAHWIGNRWAQYWPGLVEEANLDPLFKGASPESIVKSAESFYVSLGFPRLPPTFWERSDLYPVPPGDPRKKNTHASAWHVDHDKDVRSLMSVEPNEQWFGTAHHELGHIYYYLSYSRPEVPFLLREGANRAFHEAVGELARLASTQPPYLVKVGVMPAGKEPKPEGASCCKSALMESIVFTSFSAGTMSHFERDIYDAELPPGEWQKRWWSYVGQYQGVVAPNARPDELCDACTKTHLIDDPASYYDYALATLIRFQLHDHICTKILKQDVRACNYYGSKEVGDFLRGILSLGATRDWRAVIKEATGEPISPRAMDGLLRAARGRARQAQRGEGLRQVKRARTALAASVTLATLAGATTLGWALAPAGPAPRAEKAGPLGQTPRARPVSPEAGPGPASSLSTSSAPVARQRGGRARHVRRGRQLLLRRPARGDRRPRRDPRRARHSALTRPTGARRTTCTCTRALSPTLALVAETIRLARRDGLRGHALPHRAASSAPRPGEVAWHAGAARSRGLVPPLRRAAGRAGGPRPVDGRVAAGRGQRAVDPRRRGLPAALAPARRARARRLFGQARLLGQLGPLPRRAGARSRRRGGHHGLLQPAGARRAHGRRHARGRVEARAP